MELDGKQMIVQKIQRFQHRIKRIIKISELSFKKPVVVSPIAVQGAGFLLSWAEKNGNAVFFPN